MTNSELIVLSDVLPVNLNIQANNSGGSYCIPKGIDCKIQAYSADKIVVYINKDELRKVHPWAHTTSWSMFHTDPAGLIINKTIYEWKTDGQGNVISHGQVENLEYSALENYLAIAA